jgi:hypothetical protein
VVDGDSLGPVARERVPVVDVALVEIRAREASGFGFAVEADGQRPNNRIDADHGGEITVQDS